MAEPQARGGRRRRLGIRGCGLVGDPSRLLPNDQDVSRWARRGGRDQDDDRRGGGVRLGAAAAGAAGASGSAAVGAGSASLPFTALSLSVSRLRRLGRAPPADLVRDHRGQHKRDGDRHM